MYNQGIEYEWDEAKRWGNLEKHGVDLAEIANFDWDHAVTRTSPRNAERRIRAIGSIEGRLHAAIYTIRGNRRRIISLRAASRREREEYDEAYRDSRSDN